MISPLVSVLIPNWNGAGDTIECLASLEEVDYPTQQIEIVVVDNCSADDSVARLRPHLEGMRAGGKWREVQFIELESNVGTPAAYNIARAAVSADAEILLRIDNDVVFQPDAIRQLVQPMIEDLRVGAVGAFISNFRTAAPECAAIHYDLWRCRARVSFPEVPVRCDVVLGCAMAIRRLAIDAQPFFFDGSLMIFSDETDLAFRLRRAGYHVVCNPRAHVRHKGGRSSGRVPDLSRYYVGRNGVLLVRRYGGRLQRCFYAAHATLSALLAFMRGNRIPLRALRDGWRLPTDPRDWSDEQRRWVAL